MSKPSADKTEFGQRKAYRTPTLRTYGNVQQITQAGKGGSVSDNAKGDHQKTGIAAQP